MDGQGVKLVSKLKPVDVSKHSLRAGIVIVPPYAGAARH